MVVEREGGGKRNLQQFKFIFQNWHLSGHKFIFLVRNGMKSSGFSTVMSWIQLWEMEREGGQKGIWVQLSIASSSSFLSIQIQKGAMRNPTQKCSLGKNIPLRYQQQQVPLQRYHTAPCESCLSWSHVPCSWHQQSTY